MAIFSVQIEDADVPRVLDALSASYGRRDTVPNPDFDPNKENQGVQMWAGIKKQSGPAQYAPL